jgi:hypothetical protein
MILAVLKAAFLEFHSSPGKFLNNTTNEVAAASFHILPKS